MSKTVTVPTEATQAMIEAGERALADAKRVVDQYAAAGLIEPRPVISLGIMWRAMVAARPKMQ